ncbi:alkaline phosphatase family protein [soil metagenome]
MLAASSFAVACSTSDTTPAVDAGADVDLRPPTPAEWDRSVTRPSDGDATSGRTACQFKAGAMPAETLGASSPVDKDIPIDTVVVLMMENHSFDNYFGRYAKFAGRTDIESPPDDATNPTKTGATPGPLVPYAHAERLCHVDVNHGWDGTHLEWDDGTMDGFVEANEGHGKGSPAAQKDPALASGARAMTYYDERELPFYYGLAKTFAIADHYHSATLGPTWPNRMFLAAGTSFGLTFNGFPDISLYTFPDKDATILDELEKRHVSWNIYGDAVPGIGVIYNIAFLSRWQRTVKKAYAEFLTDAAAGALPQFTFLDPRLTDTGPEKNDEHPPANIQYGQRFTREVVEALMKSPQWAHTALFITWDEHGGYYDHVAPPPACAPDGTPPQLEPGDATVGKFDRYGVRVPFILVSPYAKPGYVGHAVYDHTSVLRFVQTKFKVPALTARDANADPMLDMFDFSSPKLLDPPPLPDATIDATQAAYCKATFNP